MNRLGNSKKPEVDKSKASGHYFVSYYIPFKIMNEPEGLGLACAVAGGFIFALAVHEATTPFLPSIIAGMRTV